MEILTRHTDAGSSPFEPQITYQQAGTYQVTLTGYYSACSDSVTKTVIFFPAEQNKTTNSRLATGPQGIKSITIYPNPTDGRFRVEVALYAQTDLYVFLHDTGGQELSRGSKQGKDLYSFDFDISSYASGQYYLRLVTQYDKKVARILLR